MIVKRVRVGFPAATVMFCGEMRVFLPWLDATPGRIE